jgi:hypothetical protein
VIVAPDNRVVTILKLVPDILLALSELRRGDIRRVVLF